MSHYTGQMNAARDMKTESGKRQTGKRGKKTMSVVNLLGLSPRPSIPLKKQLYRTSRLETHFIFGPSSNVVRSINIIECRYYRDV